MAAAMAAIYPFYAEKRVDQYMPLAYSFSMQTVVETPMFLRAAEDLYSEADREEIVRTIAATPEAPYPEVGHLMFGTGGRVSQAALCTFRHGKARRRTSRLSRRR
jgi:hypothetical protein